MREVTGPSSDLAALGGGGSSSAVTGSSSDLAALDPYRELQVHPSACPQVIEAAFAVLREMVLRDDSEEAPRRLARLNAAHRMLRDDVTRS